MQRSEKVYDSIDTLPQWNWIKTHETGNLAYIEILNSYRNIKEKTSLKLESIWEQIYNEYIDEFGISESYASIIEEKKKAAILKNEYIITNKKVLLNHIRIAENRIKEAEKEGANIKGMDFRESVVLIEKQQGIKIDVKKITVADYNSYIKILNKNNDGEANKV